jgi:hypothetical protein
VLDAARAGDQAEPQLRLTEHRRLSRGKPHVARQHELTAGATDAPFDLRDRDEPTRTQVAKQEAERGFANQPRCLLPVLADPRYVDVGNEVIGVGAPEHKHQNGLIGLRLLNQRDQIADQFRPEKIHGWSRDVREQHGPFLTHSERFEIHSIFLAHRFPYSVNT